MKYNKIALSILAGLAFAACQDLDDVVPAGASQTDDQVKETNAQIPSRTNASFIGMFSMMGQPDGIFQRSPRNSARADDFGFISAALSQDAEGPDFIYPENDYSWFSTCGEYSSRNADYANPYIRYAVAYNQIKLANDVISSIAADTDDPELISKLGQAYALRAFDYLSLAPFFQYTYLVAKDKPCVPLVLAGVNVDYGNNPRASVEEVYTVIYNDLTKAIALLDPAVVPARTNKFRLDQHVAYGLRARANLVMGNYGEAASDAEKAAEGFTPASIAEVSVPSFMDISEHNWIWGIDMVLNDIKAVKDGYYATSSSWLRSFSGDSYTAGAGCYPTINRQLYELIPATDVRKGWWVDDDLKSPLLAAVTWNGKTGDDIGPMSIKDVKLPFIFGVNVKFGMAKVGQTDNDDDYPMMRVEEMILLQAEALYRDGSEAEGKALLETFVKTYRDPSYTLPAEDVRSFLNEVWFQRRVELWGEGFAMPDIFRLRKNVCRFVDGKPSNWPDNFKFNISYDDPWLLMRFCTSETNENAGIVDNTGGTQPVPGQNASLTDGVTA